MEKHLQNFKKFNESDSNDQNVIMIWKSNWADEMDVHGFIITSKSESDEWVEKVGSIERRFDICIGSNEDIPYRNGQQLINEVKIHEISKNEESVIQKFFGSSQNDYFYERFF